MTNRSFIKIDDPEDPAVAEFRSIREKDLTGRNGQFIAEGSVVLRLLAAAHHSGQSFKAQKLLLLDTKLASNSELVKEFPRDVPVYLANSNVMNSIAGFDLHRGVLALGSKCGEPTVSETMLSLPKNALVLVGIGMSNHDNVGSMFRNAAAFGVNHFFLDRTSCDPLYRKAIRVSVGSVLTVPWTRLGTGTELLNLLTEHGFEIWGLSPKGMWIFGISNHHPEPRW